MFKASPEGTCMALYEVVHEASLDFGTRLERCKAKALLDTDLLGRTAP